MNEQDAISTLRERLPEFAPDIDEHFADFGGELLFHVLMGALARFYVRVVRRDPHLERRFWMTVDWLWMHGDDRVQNAIGVSLIEWFAWGSPEQQEMLREAKPLMSAAIRSVASTFLDGPRPGGRRE